MSGKRWFVNKTDGQTGQTTQVGGGSKTGAKAQDLRQRMRAQQKTGDSNSFGVSEGRKK